MKFLNLNYIFYFTVLSGVFLFSIDVNARQPILSGFTFVKDNKDDNLFHSSQTYMYKDSEDARWIIKKTTDKWLISEFISSGIYKYILGDDAVAEVKFVVSSTGEKYLATRMQDNFLPFSLETGKAGKLPFSCAFGGCACTLQCKKVSAKSSTLFGKEVRGVERAALASFYLNDDDVDGGNNFALLEKNDQFLVTRFDFDDSLKFFDILGITELRISDIMSKEQIAQISLSEETLTQMFRNQLTPYANASFEGLLGFLGRKLKLSRRDINLPRLENEVLSFIAKGFLPINDIIDARFEEVGKYYSDVELSKIYDRKKALCSNHKYPTATDKSNKHDFGQYACALTSQSSTLEIIKEFTKYMLQRRFNDLAEPMRAYSSKSEL